MPRDSVTHIITEHRYLSQSLASQYGRRHENFTGDGHLYLFESADVAVHFGLKLIAYWKQRRRSLVASPNAQDMPIRVGCHFGECYRMADEDAWIGRAINVAKRVESNAEPDSLFVTQTILELIDIPVYDFAEAGIYELRGDFLPKRELYKVSSIDSSALSSRSEDTMTAEDWFLRGVGVANQCATSLDEELRCYERAISLRAAYPEAHNNLGVILRVQGDPHGAREHYTEALRLWPQYPEAHYNFAILLEAAGELATAAAHYQEAMRLRPDHVDAILRFARLLDLAGNMIEAERHYREALHLRPGFPEAHNNLGVFLEKRGRADEARTCYVEALRLNPRYAEAHYNYASSIEEAQPELSAEHYRAAIGANPEYAEAHNNLAVLLHEGGRLEDAQVHYLAALRLRPNDEQINFNLGLLARAKGEDGEAERFFDLARKASSHEGPEQR